MKVLILATMVLLSAHTQANPVGLQGKWQLIESQCSDGSLNRAELPTAIKSNVLITYSYLQDQLRVAIEISGLAARGYGIQDCAIEVSGSYKIAALNEAQYFDVQSPSTTCAEIEFQSFAPITTGLTADSTFELSEDLQTLILTNKNQSGICSSGANAITVLRKLN